MSSSNTILSMGWICGRFTMLAYHSRLPKRVSTFLNRLLEFFLSNQGNLGHSLIGLVPKYFLILHANRRTLLKGKYFWLNITSCITCTESTKSKDYDVLLLFLSFIPTYRKSFIYNHSCIILTSDFIWNHAYNTKL